MKIEVTMEGYEQLNALVKRSSESNRYQKITNDKQARILEEVLKGTGTKEIKRALKTSDYTIYRIKKKYGLWGV